MSALLQRVNRADALDAATIDAGEPAYLGPRSAGPMTCLTMAGEIAVTKVAAAQQGGPLDPPEADDPINNEITY